MAFRFSKRIKIAPGVKINLSKSGVSASVGPRGASVNFSKKGLRGNASIPGTGISYSQNFSSGSQSRSRHEKEQIRIQNEINRLQRLSDTTIRINQDTGAIIIEDLSGVEVTGRDKTLVVSKTEDIIADWLEDQVNEINGDVSLLAEIHSDSPRLDDNPSYDVQIFEEVSPELPSEPSNIPKPSLKIPKLYFPFSLMSFMQKRHENKVVKCNLKNAEMVANWEDNIKKLNEKHARSLSEYREKLNEWKCRKSVYEEEENQLESNFNADIRANAEFMENILSVRIEGLDWPRETIVDFQIDDSKTTVWLDVDLPEIEDFPQRVAQVSSTGKRLNIKNKAKKLLQSEYARHIHGIALRLACNTLCTLPGVDNVVVSGYSQRKDPATGKINDDYLYSIPFSRQGLENIDFDNLEGVDPIKTAEMFELKRKMTAAFTIKAIEPLSPEK